MAVVDDACPLGPSPRIEMTVLAERAPVFPGQVYNLNVCISWREYNY
jgi:hypothetical protein